MDRKINYGEPFLQHIQQKVAAWRDGGYKGVERETLNILTT